MSDWLVVVGVWLVLMTAVWALSRWRPSYQRLLKKNPEKSQELAAELISGQRYGTHPGQPPHDPIGRIGRDDVDFGNPF